MLSQEVPTQSQIPATVMRVPNISGHKNSTDGKAYFKLEEMKWSKLVVSMKPG